MSLNQTIEVVLAQAPIDPLPWKAIALVTLVAIWIGVAVRLVLRGRKAYDAPARIPLDDDGGAS